MPDSTNHLPKQQNLVKFSPYSWFLKGISAPLKPFRTWCKSFQPVMSLLIWYSPMPSYFHLFIIFLPLLILCHAPCWCDLLCGLHKLSWPPSTIPYTHGTINLAPHFRFGIWPTDHTVLFPISSAFQLPNAPCCGLTDHKPSCHMVRALTPVSLHTDLVLIFVYHLYLSLLYLPHKREGFPPEFRPNSFCLIVLPHSTSYLHSTLYFWLTSHSHTVLHLCFAPSHTPCCHARRPSIAPSYHTLRASLGSHFD